MKYILTLVVGILQMTTMIGNNVQISQLIQNGNQISFSLTWDNSWRSGIAFHDAVWIFVKQAPNGGPSWIHANVNNAIVEQAYQVVLPNDHIGVFVRRNTEGNGTASTTVQLTLENPTGAYRDYKVFGTEMVYVPQGSFYLGDGQSEERFYQGNDTTQSYIVNSENEMTTGSAPSDFGGWMSQSNIPASFPKGYAAFYCMKYQITTGQYVDFLNCQDRAGQDMLTNTDVSINTIDDFYVLCGNDIPNQGNPIRCDQNVENGPINFYCDLNQNGIGDESDDGQFRGISKLKKSHLLAFLDWSGIAPMTCMEFEKACRGPLPAIGGEYAWGSTTINNAGFVINDGTATEAYLNSGSVGGLAPDNFYFSQYSPIRVGANAPASNGSRELSNASYFGIIGLSVNMNEVVYDRNYEGQHGDGMISNGEQNSFGSNGLLIQKKEHASTYNTSKKDDRVSSNGNSTNNINTFSAGRGVRRL